MWDRAPLSKKFCFRNWNLDSAMEELDQTVSEDPVRVKSAIQALQQIETNILQNGDDVKVTNTKALSFLEPSKATEIKKKRPRKPKKFGCRFCDAMFCSTHAVINHERTHTGEKPFACNFCGAHFAQRSHLKTHVKSHTGSVTFNHIFFEKGVFWLLICIYFHFICRTIKIGELLNSVVAKIFFTPSTGSMWIIAHAEVFDSNLMESFQLLKLSCDILN